MKFLVLNYSCLQNPWLGGLPPPDPSSLCLLSSTEFVEPPPEQNSWIRHCSHCIVCCACTYQKLRKFYYIKWNFLYQFVEPPQTKFLDTPLLTLCCVCTYQKLRKFYYIKWNFLYQFVEPPPRTKFLDTPLLTLCCVLCVYVPKIKKILLYKMKFLVPICWNPPPRTKFLGTLLNASCIVYRFVANGTPKVREKCKNWKVSHVSFSRTDVWKRTTGMSFCKALNHPEH